MSISGRAAMAVLRLIKPGENSFSDIDKVRKKAEKENGQFVFSIPKSKKAVFSLLSDTERECLIIEPKETVCSTDDQCRWKLLTLADKSDQSGYKMSI